MLISPDTCHSRLLSLISYNQNQRDGPHTALLAVPYGQLIASVSTTRELNEAADNSAEEPWLDEPERKRLLLGLLSQWQDDESPRIECEVRQDNTMKTD